MGCCSSKTAAPPASPADLLAADVARVAAEAAAPLPEGSTWRENGGDEIEPLFAHTDFIDAAWLLRLAEGEAMPERNGVVPLWQELPDEAKLPLSRLRRSTMVWILPVAILSYGWAARGHPDPDGSLLRKLVPTLRVMVASCTLGIQAGAPDSGRPEAWGIIWDGLSLPQRGYTTGYDPDRDDRTPYQLARFGGGLGSISRPYGAANVTTLICDFDMPPGAENPAPIERRGWCIFERCLSSLVKTSICNLSLSLVPADAGREGSEVRDWGELATMANAGRRPPLTPDAFESMLRDGMAREAAEAGTGFRFTNGKDATAVCIPQYREAFPRLLGGAEDLKFFGCDWSAEDVEAALAALAHLHAEGTPIAARTLHLEGNEVADAGAASISRLLSSGALPNLVHLWLNDAKIGDDGAASLAGAMAAGGMQAVQILNLCGNRVGDAGARALVGALAGAPSLVLQIWNNPLSEAAVREVNEACAERGGRAGGLYVD